MGVNGPQGEHGKLLSSAVEILAEEAGQAINHLVRRNFRRFKAMSAQRRKDFSCASVAGGCMQMAHRSPGLCNIIEILLWMSREKENWGGILPGHPPEGSFL